MREYKSDLLERAWIKKRGLKLYDIDVVLFLSLMYGVILNSCKCFITVRQRVHIYF